MKILVLCTGNSCRSQMAEGFLKSFDHSIQVCSAGTHPAEKVHPRAVQVMKEIGIDLSSNQPKRVQGFLNDAFDFLITVCDNARESCPVFHGEIRRRLHIGFEDPAEATGTEEQILAVFRATRDEIRDKMLTFYREHIIPRI